MSCKKVSTLRIKRKDMIKSYYEGNMEGGGPEYKILGWESKEAQQLRFNILISNIEINNKTVLDVGCGTGNLLEYLTEQGFEVNYTGVDILQSMLEYVKSKGLQGRFYNIDIFKENIFMEDEFDVIYASGIFNLNLGNNKEFLTNALRLFLKLSRKTVAFNLLSSRSPDREEKYFYFDEQEVLKLIEKACKKSFDVKIVNSYLENDFTVILNKN
ncbi:MAG: class I SAM-dependent methyltransferase [Clostridia bacterium]|nr:class I SAM-dependent methyltransferase [Clostridia bacterium]